MPGRRIVPSPSGGRSISPNAARPRSAVIAGSLSPANATTMNALSDHRAKQYSSFNKDGVFPLSSAIGDREFDPPPVESRLSVSRHYGAQLRHRAGGSFMDRQLAYKVARSNRHAQRDQKASDSRHCADELARLRLTHPSKLRPTPFVSTGESAVAAQSPSHHHTRPASAAKRSEPMMVRTVRADDPTRTPVLVEDAEPPSPSVKSSVVASKAAAGGVRQVASLNGLVGSSLYGSSRMESVAPSPQSAAPQSPIAAPRHSVASTVEGGRVTPLAEEAGFQLGGAELAMSHDPPEDERQQDRGVGANGYTTPVLQYTPVDRATLPRRYVRSAPPVRPGPTNVPHGVLASAARSVAALLAPTTSPASEVPEFNASSTSLGRYGTVLSLEGTASSAVAAPRPNTATNVRFLSGDNVMKRRLSTAGGVTPRPHDDPLRATPGSSLPPSPSALGARRHSEGPSSSANATTAETLRLLSGNYSVFQDRPVSPAKERGFHVAAADEWGNGNAAADEAALPAATVPFEDTSVVSERPDSAFSTQRGATASNARLLNRMLRGPSASRPNSAAAVALTGSSRPSLGSAGATRPLRAFVA